MLLILLEWKGRLQLNNAMTDQSMTILYLLLRMVKNF